MTLRCPPLLETGIVSDDPMLAAMLSCVLARRGHYLPIMDGPRLTRPDRTAEITRRNNALARARVKRTLLAGLCAEAEAIMLAQLPKASTATIEMDDVIGLAHDSHVVDAIPLSWGKERLGIGLLKALYERRTLAITHEESPVGSVVSRSGHLVVCETGELLSEVIAANYAYALDAGLHLIGPASKTEADELREALYSIDEPDRNPGEIRAAVARRLRELCGDLKIPPAGSITFITRSLPFGMAFPEVPTTHLFDYPDLGPSIINGFAAEQEGVRGTNVAVLVDPEKVRAPEIEAATKLLPKRGVFVRRYAGRGATVRAIRDMVELYPYDLLIFATHCGDASGYRWTYEFRDSEGIDRTLVVDLAISAAATDDPDMLSVMQYVRFHSLDGVDWNDPVAKQSLYVGKAILDYSEWSKDERLNPSHKEPIKRVIGSAAMAMADHNYLPVGYSLAGEGTPIIINNACVSWHELAGRFTYANARAYVGTLFPVSDIEAEEIVVRVIDKHFGKPLAHAVWCAQNAVYGEGGNRRPYVVTGVYPQRLRVTREDVRKHLFQRLLGEWRAWTGRMPAGTTEAKRLARDIDEKMSYYGRELGMMKKAPIITRDS